MSRHAIPRAEAGPWAGSALTYDPRAGTMPRQLDEVRGRCVVVQWLGVMIEIGVGRIR